MLYEPKFVRYHCDETWGYVDKINEGLYKVVFFFSLKLNYWEADVHCCRLSSRGRTRSATSPPPQRGSPALALGSPGDSSNWTAPMRDHSTGLCSREWGCPSSRTRGRTPGPASSVRVPAHVPKLSCFCSFLYTSKPENLGPELSSNSSICSPHFSPA